MAGSSAKMTFIGSGNLLDIDASATFGTKSGTASYAGPTLSGFGAGDMIDLKNVGGLGCQPELHAGDRPAAGDARHGTDLATLHFANATLGAGSFHAATDNAGGHVRHAELRLGREDFPRISGVERSGGLSSSRMGRAAQVSGLIRRRSGDTRRDQGRDVFSAVAGGNHAGNARRSGISGDRIGAVRSHRPVPASGTHDRTHGAGTRLPRASALNAPIERATGPGKRRSGGATRQAGHARSGARRAGPGCAVAGPDQNVPVRPTKPVQPALLATAIGRTSTRVASACTVTLPSSLVRRPKPADDPRFVFAK